MTPDLLFSLMPARGSDENETLLMVRSLRRFGGAQKDAPVQVMTPRQEPLSEAACRSLAGLNAEVIPFEVPQAALEFPFGGKVFAAAAAEARAEGRCQTLVWMDSDTLFAGDPSPLALKPGCALACRPVMLKNISSLAAEPVNPFWQALFAACATPLENLPPCATLVDGVPIRPQYNAGLLALRPERGLLRAWCGHFARLYPDPVFAPFYEQHRLYRIFIHQAVLAAVLLARLKADEISDPGPRFNHPVFLDAKKLLNDVASAAEVVTFRIDSFEFFTDAPWREQIFFSAHLQGWLEEQLG
ncbi:MAG TPA: hypothetical protein PKW33_20575 [Anaerolineaceae bacterium]|nr:hypothetical protein [Anaerolineaceae bacterium]HPN54003.1 hypothetical protein [Anaerolineaceae bacterium]